MKKLVTVLAMVAVSMGAFASDVKADIAKLYKKIDTLTKAKDIKGISKLMHAECTKDFTYVEHNVGTMKLDQFLSELGSGMSQMDKVIVAKSSFKVSKQTASLIVLKTTMNIAFMTAKDPSGKAHKFAATELSEDTLVKVGSKWKFKQMREISTKMMLDGRPFAAPQAARAQ